MAPKISKKVILHLIMEPESALPQNPESVSSFYPKVRTFFLILCVLIIISLALYLIYQNGKSIYENGI